MTIVLIGGTAPIMLARLSRHKHRVKWSILGLVAVLAAGCTPSHIDVRPRSGDVMLSRDEDLLVALVRVPDFGAGGLDVRVSSPGVFRHKHKGEESVSLGFDIQVENRSESERAAFDPRGAVLTTGLRRDLTPVVPITSAASSDTTSVAIEPGARRTFHIEFRSRATGDPRELAPFSLKLPFEYGRREWPLTVSFIRQEEPRYYYGYPGYYGGAYYGYPGYGYAYPYGPYGRWGMYGGAGWGWGW